MELPPNRLSTPLLRVTVIAAAIFIWSTPAHAYLDPTTGSVILQGLLAGIAGLMVVLRMYRGRVKEFFRRWTGSRSQAPVEQTHAINSVLMDKDKQ
jgi:hypothetical protein